MFEVEKKYQLQLQALQNIFEEKLRTIISIDKIPLFYEPMHYINNLPSKKLRPLLTLLSGLSLDGNQDTLMFPALAVELLHNFSLMHDDIMDNDSLRRGQPTVHVRWDVSTAILAGDGLLGLSYKSLLQTPTTKLLQMVDIFANAIIEICEGQALDKMFENAENVKESQYLEMISKKTAMLIKLSCILGAMGAQGNDEQIDAFASFGHNLGMAFQIQDDLLDIYANEELLGKNIGSDHAMNKKTILTIKLAEYMRHSTADIDTIDHLKEELAQKGILEKVQIMIKDYLTNACDALVIIPDNKYKNILLYLVSMLAKRNN